MLQQVKKFLYILLVVLATALPVFAQPPTISSFTPASGPVGTLVTITGTNLSTATAITIGATAAIAISNTGTQLVAMVMPGAVTGAVSVTTAGGTANGASNFTVTPSQTPNTQQGAKLVGTGNTGAASQGYSVSVSADGNTAIVGGYADNGTQGAAWIYTRSGGVWTQQGAKLVGTGNTGTAQQGSSVSLSADGNTAIVGGYADNSSQGAAWVYTRTAGVWTQQGAKLVGTGNTGPALQGWSVSVSADGNTAMVGGPSDNSNQGAAWVYTRSGGLWTQQGAKRVGTGNTGAAQQGISVSVSADGNTAMVGGYTDNSGQGAAWVYTRTGGVWTQQGTKLAGTGNIGAALQGVSVSVSADGNTAIVGGYQDNSGQGAAWVFTAASCTVTLSSAVGTNAQTVCNNTPITNITYATTNATGAIFSGLPAGVTGSWASNVATISGTPTASGTFNYTVTTTGGCPPATATGTITVNPTANVSQPANQVVCRNTATAAVIFTGSLPGTVFNWTNNTPSIGLAASGTGNIASFTGTNATNAPVTATITVTPGISFAYIANVNSNTISVINTATNTVIGSPIAVASGPFAVSASSDGSRVYITNANTDQVSVINTATNALVGSLIAVGDNPTGIAVSPDGSCVYVANNLSNTVSVINTASSTVVATVAVGSGPFGITVSPNGTRVYVSNANAGTVSVINTATNTVIGSAIAVGSEPDGLCISPDGNWVYVANNISNTVSVISTATNTVSGSPITVGIRPRGICISPDGTRVYVTNQSANTVSVINTATNTVVGSPIAVGGTTPYGIAVSADGSRVYTTNFSSGNVSVINTATNTVVGSPITVGSGPFCMGNFVIGNPTCAGTARTFTYTINPTPNAVATPASQTMVSTNAITTIALSGNVSGTVYNWTRDNNATVTGIAASGSGNISGSLTNTTTSPVTVTFTITPTYTNAGTTCTGTQITAVVTVNALNVWTGGGTTDMNLSGNWSLNITPSATLDANIPAGNTPYPISTADITVKNLTIGTGATVTIGNGTTLTINAAVAGAGTITGSPTSNLTIAGAATTLKFTQTSASTRSLNNLLFTTAVASTTLGSALDVYGNIKLNNGVGIDGSLNLAGQNLTLKSNSVNTASIDKLTVAGTNLTNATNVTVERYIPLRHGLANGGRSYRLLTPTVTTTTTIKANWQNGETNTVVGTNINAVNPGFGVQITGTGGSAAGLDVTQNNQSSLYTTTNGPGPDLTYTAVPNTNVLTLNALKGYFLYIRGDRSSSMQLPYNPAGGMPTTTTTLTAKGTVQKGSISFPVSSVTDEYSMITNPYAAPIDWSKVVTANSGKIYTTYTAWDAFVGTEGSFVVVQTNGTNNTAGSTANQYIQPGQAFLVRTLGGSPTTISITEDMKAVGNNNNTIYGRTPTTFESFAIDLYLTEANNERHTADGVLVSYDNGYSTALDGDDAGDVTSWNENIAIARAGKEIAMEARPVIISKDTIPLLIGGLRQTTYEWVFTPSMFTHIGLKAELIDNFLNTRTLLSVIDSVVVPFTVTANPASSAANRFMVVFGPFGPLAIDVITINAKAKNNAVQIDWTAKTEQEMDRYELERSFNGTSFSNIKTTAAVGNSPVAVNYSWLDLNPLTGNNFYRIKAVDKAGLIKYTNIVKIGFGKTNAAMAVSPNPVIGNILNLKLSDLPKGSYTVQLYNSIGQQVFVSRFNHSGGSVGQPLSLPSDLASGTYWLVLSGDETRLQTTIIKN